MNILCVTDYFLPGFRGGGPIRTLDNMRKQLVGRAALQVFTRDRDLGSDGAYEGVESNCWVETPDGPIWYASPETFGPRGLKRVLATGRFDIVYLNSFFSPRSSILPYLALRRSMPHMPILLAPRGEFSLGALAMKKPKKLLFLRLARGLGLYRDLFWHASTPLEAADILRQFPEAEGRIHVAPDPVHVGSTVTESVRTAKHAGRLRIVFISRVSPMKNLDGLLEMLVAVGAEIELDIFGPVEDESYWRRCEALILALPRNIHVRSHGPVAPADVLSTFSGHDLFAFPTHGENFGHVIFEALRAGTPVLLSDRTPWRDDRSGAVTVVPLDDVAAWRIAIEQAAACSPEDHARRCEAAVDYAYRYAVEDGSLQANVEMFRVVCSSRGDAEVRRSYCAFRWKN